MWNTSLLQSQQLHRAQCQTLLKILLLLSCYSVLQENSCQNVCPTSTKQIYDKPKHSWRAQVSQRTHHFWHAKQWHMFNHTGNCSVRKSQDALLGLFCDTGWAVWYPKVHYYSAKPQVDISFMLQPQNILFSHTVLPSEQAKKKHSKQEFQTKNSLCASLLSRSAPASYIRASRKQRLPAVWASLSHRDKCMF